MEIKPYIVDNAQCEICDGLMCGGLPAIYFCTSCIQYYCEHCWNFLHYSPINIIQNRYLHKPHQKLACMSKWRMNEWEESEWNKKINTFTNQIYFTIIYLTLQLYYQFGLSSTYLYEHIFANFGIFVNLENKICICLFFIYQLPFR